MFERAEEEIALVIKKLEARLPSKAAYRTLWGCYGNLGFIGLLTSAYTRDYSYVRYFELARQYYEQSPYEVKPPLSVLSATSYFCRVTSEEKGEMERYIDAITAAVPLLSFFMSGCSQGIDDLARGEAAFFKGDLSGAEQFCLLALNKARQNSQYETENRALFYLLRINLAWGKYEVIQDIFKQLEAQLDTVNYINRFVYYDIVSGWYYSQLGQPDRVAPWLKNDFEENDLHYITHSLEIIIKAKYYFSEKHYPAVLAVLEDREEWNHRWNFVLGRIEKKALEAVCRYHIKDREGAFAALEEAWKTAHSNALYMPFMELGKDMRSLADAALKAGTTGLPPAWLEKIRRNASSYAKKLFIVAEQCRPAAPHGRKDLHAAAALSRREKEVLTGLSQGLTRDEIAGLSSLSVNTVKSVIRSIYNKLGAINRADAVRIATQLGLLEYQS
jgi:LuxR family maltose regulon positive regulatory protein